MVDEYERDNDDPQGADRGSGAQLPNADTLEGPVDGDDDVFVPPDRPIVSEQDDMTARGMREGETLEQRLHREEPDTQTDAGLTGDADPAEQEAMHVVDIGAALGETEPPVDPAAVADRAADAEVDRASDDAARIDALRDAAGTAAAASGRVDAGDVPGL